MTFEGGQPLSIQGPDGSDWLIKGHSELYGDERSYQYFDYTWFAVPDFLDFDVENVDRDQYIVEIYTSQPSLEEFYGVLD